MAKEAYCWLRGQTAFGCPILYCRDWSFEQLPSQELQDLELILICGFNRPMLGRHLAYQQQRIASLFPRWQVWVAAPTLRLVRESQNSNVVAFSESLLTRADFWQPTQHSLYYSAVTVAGWEQYNKHELLVKLDRVLILTGNDATLKDREAVVRKLLFKHYFHVTRAGGYDNADLARDYFTQAACGLALSDIDGGASMVAAMQLAGLPIVATRSRVGALELCDLEFVRIVPADPTIIAAAVREFENELPAAYDVRLSFHEKLLAARAVFMQQFGPVNWDDLPVVLSNDNPFLWRLPI